MATDTTCLFTVVRNISGGEKYFSFLGPRGTTLADNEEFAIFGHLSEYVQRGNFGDRGGSHWVDGLLDVLGENDDSEVSLEIVSTPAPILYDPTAEESKMLILDDGSLDVLDPCWTSEAA